MKLLLMTLLFGSFLLGESLLCYNCDLLENNNTRCNENQPVVCEKNQGCGTLRDGKSLRKMCTIWCPRGDGASMETCRLCARDLCNSHEDHSHQSGTPTAHQSQNFNGTIYTLYTKATTFWDAQNLCLRNDETLVNIEDVKVQEFIETSLDVALIGGSAVKGFWMGAISADGNDWIWTDTGNALQPPPKGGYVCPDNRNKTHQNWILNHPLDGARGRHFCGAVMLTKSFQWMSFSCGETVAAFLCQRPQTEGDERSTYMQSTIYKEEVYTFYSQERDATTAHQACFNTGTQLAMLHSLSVRKAVSQQLAFAIKKESYWSEQQCKRDTSNQQLSKYRTSPVLSCSTKLPYMCQKPFAPATAETCRTTRKPEPPTTPVTSQSTALQTTSQITSPTTEGVPPDARVTTSQVHAIPEVRLDGMVCPGTTLYGDVTLTFNDTAANTWSHSKEKCSTGVPVAKILCDVWTLKFNESSLTYDKCNRTIHDVKIELLSDVRNESVDLVKYSSAANAMTSGSNLTGHNVQDAIDVLLLLDQQLHAKDYVGMEMEKALPKVTTTVLDDVIDSVDNICDHLHDNEVSDEKIASLHRVVEDFAASVVIGSKQSVYKYSAESIDVQVVDLTSNLTGNETDLRTFVSPASQQSKISINNDGEDAKRVYFVSYTNSTLFPSRQDVKEVFTATVLDNSNNEVSVPVTFSFQRNKKSNSCLIETCSYYVPSSQSWSTHGCTHLHDVKGDDDVITCVCNHTTSFGVVVSLKDDHVDVALDIASEVGLGVCVFFLILTIILFIKLPELQRVRSANIHVNLCLCLTLTYLTFLLGVNETTPRGLCVVIAALIHYFLLAAWGWMAVESITMYRMFVTSMDRPRLTEFWKMALSVYTSAALVVGATMMGAWLTNTHSGTYNEDCVYQDAWSNYVGGRYCWLTEAALYSFVAIVGVLLLVNVVLAFLVIKAITWGRRKVQSSTDETPAIHVLRAVLVAILMGLSWVFAIPIVVSQDHVVQLIFGWFFAISTSLQGLFVFYFFCLRRGEVRSAWVDPVIRALCTYRRKSTKGPQRNDSSVGMTSSRSWRRFTTSQRATNTTTTG